MYFLYSLLLTVGFVLLLPRFAIDALRTRKYVTGLGQRLGNLPQLAASDLPLIWLHCVSVGETEAARPLVKGLRERFPSHRLVVSTTTVTGQKVAQRVFAGDATLVFYFPIDWVWTVRRVLRVLKPSAILIMETELWPNLLRECRRESIPVAVVNGRISAKSFRRYRKIRPLMARILSHVSTAIMQSDEDVARIRELGMASEHALCSGNLKFDSATDSGRPEELVATLRDRFGFNRDQFVIVAASTHAPEEQVVIEAFKQIRQAPLVKPVRLVIAPRRPERFKEALELMERSGLAWARRSDPQPGKDPNSDLILMDSIGELRSLFPLADLAFIGGSIAPHGGHNVLEPAVEGVCVITGPHIQNFAAIMHAFLAEDAIVQLPQIPISEAPAQLARTVSELLQNDSRRRQIGQRAKTLCQRNRGATERTIQILAGLLATPSTADDSLPLSAIRLTTAK